MLVGNEIEYPEAEIAIAKAGAGRVPMLISSSAAEIVRYVEFSDAAVVLPPAPGLPPCARRAQRMRGSGGACASSPSKARAAMNSTTPT